MSGTVIFLQNQDVWLEMIEFNTLSGEVKVIKRSDELKISGHYGKINNEIVMLYKKDNSLYLNLKNKEIPLNDKNVSFSFERIGKNNKFSINSGSDILYSEIYPSCIYDPVNIADFDFNEDREEDQDFFLFVYNVMQDKERQKRLYT